jgi:hypothetical protein
MSVPSLDSGSMPSFAVASGHRPRYRHQALAKKQFDPGSKLAGRAATILNGLGVEGATPLTDIFKIANPSASPSPLELEVEHKAMASAPQASAPPVPRSRYRFTKSGAQTEAAVEASKGIKARKSYPMSARTKQKEMESLAYRTQLSVFDVDGHRYGVASFEVDAGDKNKPPLEFVAWVDRTGSMSGAVGLEETRMSLAKDGVDAALDLLGDNDRFSILTFNKVTYNVFGHQFATEANKATVRQMLKTDARFIPSDSTYIPQAYDESRHILDFALQANEAAGIPSVGFSLGLTDGQNSVGISKEDIERIHRQHKAVESVLIGVSPDHNQEQCKLIMDTSGGAYLDSSDPRKLKALMLRSIEKVQSVVFEGKSTVLSTDGGAKITEIWHPLNFSPVLDPKTGSQIIELPSKLGSRKMYKLMFELDRHSEEGAKITAVFHGKDLLTGRDMSIEASSTIERARKMESETDHLYMEFFHYQNVLAELKIMGDKEVRKAKIQEAIQLLSIENLALICSLLEIGQANEEGNMAAFLESITAGLSKPYNCSWKPSEIKCHEIAKFLENMKSFHRVDRVQSAELVKTEPLFYRFSISGGEGYLVACSNDGKGGCHEETLQVLDEKGTILVDAVDSVRNSKVYSSIAEYTQERQIELVALLKPSDMEVGSSQ